MDIMACVELVERIGKTILISLVGIGGLGVIFHAWLSSELAFFDFGKLNSIKKGNLKRLFIPLILVFVLSLLTPLMFILVSPELKGCLENSKLASYLGVFWSYVFPVVGTGLAISSLLCAFIGSVAYFGIGLVSYLITKWRDK